MVSVKIECNCGQHYAFDVEPVNGQMTSPVACPVCGVDGTAIANDILARNEPPTAAASATVAPPQTGVRLKIAALEHSTETPVAVKKTVTIDLKKIEIEARAKISWGDSEDDVIKFMMLQGISAADASALVREMFKERLKAVRGNGIKKILKGFGLICVPIVELLFFAYYRMVFIKPLAIGIAAALWGCWLVLNGIIMLVAPKMESGDVADQ